LYFGQKTVQIGRKRQEQIMGREVAVGDISMHTNTILVPLNFFSIVAPMLLTCLRMKKIIHFFDLLLNRIIWSCMLNRFVDTIHATVHRTFHGFAQIAYLPLFTDAVETPSLPWPAHTSHFHINRCLLPLIDNICSLAIIWRTRRNIIFSEL